MSEDVDHLLQRRMNILMLDVDTIGREFPDVFKRVRTNCPLCEDRPACVLDLTRDPTIEAWEADCPNADVLGTLVALTGSNR